MTKLIVPFWASSWGWVWSTVTAFHVDSEGILQREVPRYLESSSGFKGKSLLSPNITSWKVADSFSCTSSEMFVINQAWFITAWSCSQSSCISHSRRSQNGKRKVSWLQSSLSPEKQWQWFTLNLSGGPKCHCHLGPSLYPPDQWFSARSDFCPLPRTCQSLEMYLICLLVLLVKVGKEELGRNSILKSGFGDLSKYLWWSRGSYLELPPGHS